VSSGLLANHMLEGEADPMEGGAGVAVSGVAGGGVVVERSGACVSIRATGVLGDRRPEAMLPAEPGRTAVVVDDQGAAALHALDRGLLGDLDRHLWTVPGGRRQGLRLLISAAARPDGDGGPALAARLAEELGVEVVAPDGTLVVLGRGELFSVGAAGGWWRFARGRGPEWAGPRFPAPDWQSDLPADVGARVVSGATVTPVPAGLWVRGAGGPVAALSDPGFAVPPASILAVVVGRPGEPWPAVDGLAEVIGGLPPVLQQRFVLVPYGLEPAGQAPLAQRLADRLGVDVRAAHGLPGYAADGSLDFALVDDAGRRTWRPLLTESVYHPGGRPPTRSNWSAPLAGLPSAGPGSFELVEGWLVEVVASGLLVRPAASALEPAVLRRPADPRQVDLVVTAAVREPDNVPVSVLGAVGRMARALPPAVRDRLRMLITDQVDPPELLGLAGALRLPIGQLSGDRITPVGGDEGAFPADPFRAKPPAQVDDLIPEIPPADRPAQHARPAAPGHPAARPDSVGRLRASDVPTAAGPPPVAVATARPVSTADGASVGSPPAPAGSGGAARAETPAPAVPGGGRSVTIQADGRIRPVRGRHPESTNDAAAGDASPAPTAAPTATPTAVPAGGTQSAPHHAGPGRSPQPSPPTASSPAPARAAPPTSPAQAEQPLPTPARRDGPAPAGSPAPAGPPPGGPVAAGPAGGAPVPAVPAAGGLVLVTPDRAGGVESWWQQGATAVERQQFRLSLGWRFDAASRYVTRLLSRRPGLRAAVAGDEGVSTDLAAVQVFAASDHTDLVESLRAGSVRPADRTFVSCVVSGLRRLPTLPGVVVRGGPEDPTAARVYVPGSEVVEMGLLMAVADPAAQVSGGVEVLIWSSTARRLDGLVEGGEEAQVVFLPGTVFRVLDVERTDERCRVLLAEVPRNWRGVACAGRDERIRGWLRDAARARATDGTGQPEQEARQQWASRSLMALPGLVPAESLSGAA
jgi:hypothetical protein